MDAPLAAYGVLSTDSTLYPGHRLSVDLGKLSVDHRSPMRHSEGIAGRRHSETIMYELSKQDRGSSRESDDSPQGQACQSTQDIVMSETEASLRRTRLQKTNTGTFSGGSGPTMSDTMMTISDNKVTFEQDLAETRASRPWLNWLEKDKFKLIIIAAITLNMWMLAIEIDFPEWPSWHLTNMFFLLFYIGEVILRSAHRGAKTLLCHRHSKLRLSVWYDLFVIVVGILDLVFAKLCTGSRSFDFEEFMHSTAVTSTPLQCTSPLVRCLQLSRLLRVPRIVHLIPDLSAFVRMIVTMFGNVMGWIFGVIFVFCFIIAIVLTRLLGHGLVVNDISSDSPKVEEMFVDIPTSMFTLFQLTTADDWMDIAEPVISMNRRPFYRFIWRLFFIFFITFMCWTMLSLLTAVASETMISNTSYKKRDLMHKQEMQRQQFISFLCEEFVAADGDGNGVLDKNEFTELMHTPSVKNNMKEHGINLEDNDIERTWKTFDVDDSGVLDINELVDGFALLQEGLATKHVATIGYSLKRFSLQTDQDMDCLEEGSAKLQDQVQELRQQIQAQQKNYHNDWNRFLQQQSESVRAQ